MFKHAAKHLTYLCLRAQASVHAVRPRNCSTAASPRPPRQTTPALQTLEQHTPSWDAFLQGDKPSRRVDEPITVVGPCHAPLELTGGLSHKDDLAAVPHAADLPCDDAIRGAQAHRKEASLRRPACILKRPTAGKSDNVPASYPCPAHRSESCLWHWRDQEHAHRVVSLPRSLSCHDSTIVAISHGKDTPTTPDVCWPVVTVPGANLQATVGHNPTTSTRAAQCKGIRWHEAVASIDTVHIVCDVCTRWKPKRIPEGLTARGILNTIKRVYAMGVQVTLSILRGARRQCAQAAR
mmetsp:Transcript_132825/g.343659  ORF Transcript_132825/g.343659 Transcript_132825/m.343659 type:complete len:294 (+) Transcript_132825:64-945(+)